MTGNKIKFRYHNFFSIQKLLKLKADGLFGEGTENALMRAQEAHGLTVDGICGPASWKALSGADKYL